MARVREVDGVLRISSLGRAFGLMLVWGGGALLLESIAVTERRAPWFLHVLAGLLGLVSVSELLTWLAVPRVAIDTRSRVVIVGKARTPWDELGGVVRAQDTESGPNGSRLPQHTIYLVSRDGSRRMRIAVTTSEPESRAILQRVAETIGLPILADDGYD